ncbi:CoA-binding protein [Radiobacillus deserti]|uniref:CoA-binding protein n=1 Tax=Radiobacillus deserti TaxID=2594883 RepID=A0A516KFY6_9BACI|nr:CoA-binding protein [Radiobacillus deserti]QDP40304.1 CoA-binding protein [Radiobacillus deserti]
MELHPNKETLKQILETSKTIAVVGLSDRPNRTSYQIAKAMQAAGYRIIPVNPEITETLGEKAYARLGDIEEPFDIINVFRRSEYLPELAKEAVQTDAKVFWAQQGIWNEEAYHYLKEHDFTVVMDLCIKVAHSLTIQKR